MYRFADNVVERSTTTTTGAYQLGGVPSGAEPGARGFVAGVGDTNTCDYYAREVGGSAWERGIGTVADAATDTLTRTTVHTSSNANAAVDWTGKTVEIIAVQPARLMFDLATPGVPVGYDSYAWAGRPAAASYTGRVIRITDVGPSAGSLFISDGTYWVPLNGSVVLFAAAEMGLSTTSTTEAAVSGFSYVVKAGLFRKPGSFLRTTMRGRRTGTPGSTGNSYIFVGKSGDSLSVLGEITALNAVSPALRGIAVVSRVSDTQIRSNNKSGAGGSFADFRDDYPSYLTSFSATADETLGLSGKISSNGTGETIWLDEMTIELIVP